jgi:plasmid maintenance system killer protein
VKSETTERFRSQFAAAPAERQSRIRSAYRLWVTNPAHPSLRFKKVHPHLPIYSVRVDRDWRAVGVLKDDTVVWFWVGPHPLCQYDLQHLPLRD